MLNQLSARSAVFDASFALLTAAVASAANLSLNVAASSGANADANELPLFTAAGAATVGAVNERHALVARQLATIDFVAAFVERCAAPDAVVGAWPALQAALRDSLLRGHVATHPLLFVSATNQQNALLKHTTRTHKHAHAHTLYVAS